jgi:cell division protein FtsI/penicillin-binding protein 2
MWMAVNQPGGTAGKVRMPDIEVAAKTGTAQTIDNGQKSHNSWLISFAPYENPNTPSASSSRPAAPAAVSAARSST